MRIIPVLDVRDHIVVHAKRGRRKEYRPLQSNLCQSADPLQVARALVNAFGFGELYVADLDAIDGRETDHELLGKLSAETRTSIMVDAGINELKRAAAVLNAGASKVVVGTETLETLESVSEIVQNLGSEKVVLSIDKINGRILTRCREISHYRTEGEIMNRLRKVGISEFILLDLSRVGSACGVDIGVIRKPDKKTSILVGGGIANIKDIEELQKVGVAGVLVATALHTGVITPQQLARLQGFLA